MEEIEKEVLSIKNKTIISVSHRIFDDLVKEYDEVIYLEKGKIQGST